MSEEFKHQIAVVFLILSPFIGIAIALILIGLFA
jgi:phosphate/sulfate permease